MYITVFNSFSLLTNLQPLIVMNDVYVHVHFSYSLSYSRGLVTDTALQRRIAEMLVEHCHWFFPDLPETPPPVFSNNKHNCHSSLSPSSSYSSYSSSYGPATKTPDRSSYSSDDIVSPLPTSRGAKDPEVEKESNLPHPLADNAFDEGVTVHLVQDVKENAETKEVEKPPEKPEQSSPKPAVHPKPTMTNASPIPKPRNMSTSSHGFSRTSSGETPEKPPEKPPRFQMAATQNGAIEEGQNQR